MCLEFVAAHVDHDLPLDETDTAVLGKILALRTGAEPGEGVSAGGNTNFLVGEAEDAHGRLGCGGGGRCPSAVGNANGTHLTRTPNRATIRQGIWIMMTASQGKASAGGGPRHALI